jgi:hypothetical protein
MKQQHVKLKIFFCNLLDVISNLNYEKACVLYRIAGLYSEFGCSQNWVSTDGIRKACQYFQVPFFVCNK